MSQITINNGDTGLSVRSNLNTMFGELYSGLAGKQPAGAYLTANQVITLSGDVTGSGSTAIAVTIGAHKVSRGMLAPTSGAALLGSTAAGDVTDLTAAQARTLLGLSAVAVSGAYSDLTGKPVLAAVATSGSYADLTGRPALAAVATSGSYADLTGTPTLSSVALSGDYGDLLGAPTLAPVATSGDYADLTNTPALGTASSVNLSVGTTAPASPAVNDLWVDTN